MRVIMIVPRPDVKGGIASVVSGYYGSRLTTDEDVVFIESYRDGTKWQKLGKALACYAAFCREILLKKPDLVHVHSSFGPSFYRKLPIIFLSHAAHIPVVNHIHGSALDDFYTNASRFKKWLVRRVYGWCGAVIVLTDYWKKELSEIVPAERIRVIPNYTEIKSGVPDPRSGRSRSVLFMGVITEAKGCLEMPAMMRLVREKIPDAEMIMCGTGEEELVRRAAEENGCAEAFRFPGWVRGEEKDRQFRTSAVFILPSHNEALPVSVMEGMSYGLPVVATRTGGIPALVEDGVNGRLFEVGDYKGMAEAVIRYLEDPDLREKDGLEGIRIVKERLSLEKHIEQLEKLYESL